MAHHDDVYLDAPRYFGPPRPEHACAARGFQGIPGIARAANGRLWATWYGGGLSEDQMNYLLLATSAGLDHPWTPPVRVLDPDGPGPVRAFDPCLWHDPSGRLWLFWSQGVTGHIGSPRWGVWASTASDSGVADPDWSRPVRLCDGIMMNKPLVATTGEWLLPVARWQRPGSAGVVVSRDGGRTFSWLGRATAPAAVRTYDEHMIVERRDGTLWMLVRTLYGIGESVSADRGRTWSPIRPSALPHCSSRFHIRRLRSGRLLLVKHGGLDAPTRRSHLTAFLSDDDGRSWTRRLLLDERLGVSYPDGVETEDGTQIVIYDFDRYETKAIHLAVFREADVGTGRPPERLLVHRAGGPRPARLRLVRAERCRANPLLTPASHPSLGANLNGPCLIRVPDWVRNPLGRYYLYFAHHQGTAIRMAYADAVTGPYTVYAPGVLDLADTPFRHHIASPDVRVDPDTLKITLLYHGSGPTEPNPGGWAQSTVYAESEDGLRFVSDRVYLAESYMRTFFRDGWHIGFSGGVARRLRRSRSRRGPYEAGPVLEVEGEPFAPPAPGQAIDRMFRMRHVAFHVQGDTLRLYYSNVGDVPERIKRTPVALDGDWTGWRGGPVEEVVRPEKRHEGAALPIAPSAGGAAPGPVHELRDPFVFEEGGRVWLFYTVAGERGLALAEIRS